MGDPISLAVGGAVLGGAIGHGAAFTAAGAALGGLAGFGASKLFGGKKSSDTSSRTIQSSTSPSVANDLVAEKSRRKLVGRNALIASQQEDTDILGEPKLARNELTAF